MENLWVTYYKLGLAKSKGLTFFFPKPRYTYKFDNYYRKTSNDSFAITNSSSDGINELLESFKGTGRDLKMVRYPLLVH